MTGIPVSALGGIVGFFGLMLAAATGSDAGPQPPCGGEASPAYGALDNPPAVQVWDRSDLGRNWAPPACTGWTTPGFASLVAVAGRFRYSGELAGEIGAISKLTGIRYWSTTHKQWQTLVLEAHAAQDASGEKPRKDFSSEELGVGQVRYFRQKDNLSGDATYRMGIVSRSTDRIVFDIQNVSPIRYFLITMFGQGEMQSIYFLDRESPGVWRYYSITRTGKNASRLTVGHEASSINRAIAYFRRLAGIPTDMEPPAAR